MLDGVVESHTAAMLTPYADDPAIKGKTFWEPAQYQATVTELEPDLAAVIELKFFCGLSFAEIAAVRGVSERTIQRNWEKGRLYLHHAIGGAGATPVDSFRIRRSSWEWGAGCGRLFINAPLARSIDSAPYQALPGPIR
jgi:predicted DNA-binding protein (UPF0251 family)